MRGLLLTLCFMLFFAGNASSAEKQKEWTILVFISGHNDLDGFGHADIKEMEQVGSNDDINIVVQRGTLEGTTTPRYYIEKSNSETQITSPVVEEMPRVDMGDYKELIKFIEWGVKKYPAKKYFVDVWNHGTGWHQTPMLNIRSLKQQLQLQQPEDIGFDDLTGSFITTEEMKIVMERAARVAGQKIDVYGSDACLMGMLEVAAEMKDSVKYFIGSQELEPLPGWPYHLFLEKLSKNPSVEGDIAGQMLTESYEEYYNQVGNPYGTTFSVMDMSYFDDFLSALKDLKNSFLDLDKATIESIKFSAMTAESFAYSDYRDVFHFLKLLNNKKQLPLNFQLIQRALNLQNRLIFSNANSEIHPNAFGVSIWLPTYEEHFSSHQGRYKNLVFNKETGWLEFLQVLQ